MNNPVPPRLRFDRNEWAGAFGDMGTDLPLLVGMTLAARLDGASVLIVFGVLQVFTALAYRLPMPVQPLKAMAAMVIAQKLGGDILFGAGLAIGLVMLLLSLSGALDWLARIVPKCVVRGIQFGLGLQLARIALGNYVPAEGGPGYLLAAVAFVVTLLLLGNRKYPAALIVIALGLVYTFTVKSGGPGWSSSFGFGLPQLHLPAGPDILTGFLVLALPQIPLSLGNSVLATRQVAADFFPERPLTVRRIGLTYSLMNLLAPWLSGVPVCHGSGGMAGHYSFGARTGGSVLIYGSFLVVLGMFFGAGFGQVIQIFPLPILGVLLFFEAIAMIRLMRDMVYDRRQFLIAVLAGLCAVLLPYGYAVSVVLGSMLYYGLQLLSERR